MQGVGCIIVMCRLWPQAKSQAKIAYNIFIVCAKNDRDMTLSVSGLLLHETSLQSQRAISASTIVGKPIRENSSDCKSDSRVSNSQYINYDPCSVGYESELRLRLRRAQWLGEVVTLRCLTL